jgi:inorganic triphosphatase YgiF
VAELSLDRGQIITGDVHRRAVSFLLLEAELLDEGYENDLEKLVWELRTAWRLAPERRSKFERGLALLGLKLPATKEQIRS